MRLVVSAWLLVSGMVLVAAGQARLDTGLGAQLKQLFPSAVAFSPKESDPPHFTAFINDGRGARVTAGFAFWTTELDPLERGYGGPIKILIGMDTTGVLTGIVVVEHHEPYGYFSVEPPRFAAQFKGKSIRDPFRVGADIDAVSRASISVTSASRAVRNSARRIARELLSPDAVK